MLWEVCAGLLDKDDPETCIKKEAMEETGYQIESVQKVMEAYMSPGSVSEKLYYFIAAYTAADKVNLGGGVAEEQEEVEVREFKFEEALQMVKDGRIQDAKTIILLQYAQLNRLFD
jgi:nudix-type nucleoside diphosphatase (YffH/AdpP family)